jgi:hypothetical protein
MSHQLTQQALFNLVVYDQKTGVFTWKARPLSFFENERSGKTWNARFAGKVIQTKRNGYIFFRIFDKHYGGHRLAWLYVYGVWPTAHIDHVNGVRDDNRIANLRDVSIAENQKNQKMRADNKSGVAGVHWARKSRKWYASIRSNGRVFNLGYYANKEDAIAARKSGEIRFGYSPIHGLSPNDRACFQPQEET